MANLKRLRPADRPAFTVTLLAAAIAAFALGAATLLSSCSYLLGDPYGAIGQRAVAWVDLNSAVKSATGSGVRYVNRMSYLSSGGHAYLFLYINTDANTQLFAALDGTSLNLVDSIPSSIYYQSGSNIAVDMNGNFVTSYPSALALSPTLAIAAPLPAVSGPYCLAADGSNNISLQATSGANSLSLASYSSSWGADSSTPVPLTAGIDPGWQLSDAAVANNQLLLLFTASGMALEVAYPASSIYSTLSGAGELIDYAPAATAIAPFNSQSSPMAWLTSEGLVVGSYANNGLELDLYKLGGFGKSSSYTLGNNGSSQAYVEPDGRYFYYYEQSSGRLYKMRTWW
ncbi:MAG TPA: hypothetical protein VMV90_09650 [Rectinemataceae bacterium]|nr:hypothetical protein [Rectinemataceae bacterium]